MTHSGLKWANVLSSTSPLAQKPESGGMPAMARNPMVKVTVVHFM